MKIMIGFTNQYQAISYKIFDYLKALEHDVTVVKQHDDITVIAHEVGKNISQKIFDRAVIIDDFAQLPFMIATKYPHTMVAPLFNEYSAELTIEHNNTNIICLGAAINSDDLMMELVKVYFNFTFDAGRHLVRTNMIDSMLKGGS